MGRFGEIDEKISREEYLAPLIRLRPWRYINLLTYLLTYLLTLDWSQSKVFLVTVLLTTRRRTSRNIA